MEYLLLWGHHRLMVELHERLQGKLSDPTLKIGSTGNLGSALYMLGQYRRTIEFYEQALAIARDIGDRQVEGVLLGNLVARQS
jgi:tetratricopeptide (TPR) repeat protein